MSKIVGVGKQLPKRRMFNHEFEDKIDTSDEWILSRTGIQSRHIIEDETLTALSVAAVREALAMAGVEAADVGVLLTATMTADDRMPSMACRIAGELAIEDCLCFDVNAACSGFIFAYITADRLLRSAQKRYALVVGAEALSRVLDWQDRNTCILFGDGAGAVLLEADGRETPYVAGTRPDMSGQLTLAQTGLDYLAMKGREVYKFATHIVPQLLFDLCTQDGIEPAAIDKVVAHQANIRILQSAAEKTSIDIQRWFSNLADHGNTSAASVPMALYDAYQSGFLQKGERAALAGFGGGLTYGGVLIDWTLTANPNNR